MPDQTFDITILGGGPGGYTAAIRASQLGMSVALVEKGFLGGTCLNIGCIPSKVLIHCATILNEAKSAKTFGLTIPEASFDWAAIQKYRQRIVMRLRKGTESLMKKNNITVFNGFGKLKSSDTIEIDGTELKSKHIILAPGSYAKSLPSLPVDGERIITSDHALMLEKLPASVLIVGAGAIGCEFAYVLSSMGVEVVTVEFLECALPMEEEDLSAEYEEVLRKKKIKQHVRNSVEKVEVVDGMVKSTVRSRDTGEATIIETEKVLVSIGRGPATSGCGFEEVGIPIENGFIKVDEYNRTGVGNIRAIGDAVGGFMLAHKASAEGIFAVENIAGIERAPMVMSNIPRVTYSKPEVGSVGIGEKRAMEKYGDSVKVGKFPFTACGKAVIIGEGAGFVKLISAGPDGKLVGAHAIGPLATEIISVAGTAISLGATAREFAHLVLPHPTLSEAWHEAAHALFEGPINF